MDSRTGFQISKVHQPKSTKNKIKAIEKEQKKLLKYRKPHESPLDISPQKISIYYNKAQNQEIERKYNLDNLIQNGGLKNLNKEDKEYISIYQY
mmetsp:Transcript_21577/g.19144  ORF Transcript_21577/g.19144 Transcript_21577/m.19144 type:complete len:94 (-) Transcript_21577:24-305(-)